MTQKEKSKELVDKFKDYVHGYVGSSMLSNYEYPEQILAQAKKVAIIAVDEIIEELIKNDTIDPIEYWEGVKTEIEKL